MAGKLPLTLLNETEATFDCTFGRGCEGKCCQNGRPGLHDREYRLLRQHLHKFLPHLRPAARAVIERTDIVTRRYRNGVPMVPVQAGWCVFFNEGCVLHKVGAAEGDALKYKPVQCALFPLLEDDNGQWFVSGATRTNPGMTCSA
ncbi:MAG TPA: DUF3109 family protein [Gemmatales bacterium]|nr:DUF3109 family protein [Gemmatales bacterium]